MSPSDSRARPDPFAGGGKAEGEPEPDLDQFISGIYNYCDRWCERCSMTARCYVFWQEKRAEASPISNGGCYGSGDFVGLRCHSVTIARTQVLTGFMTSAGMSRVA
jgi:hypothetical protein